MEQASQLTEFGKIFIFLIIGILLVSVTIFLSWMIAPKKPTPLKLTSYECGEEPTGSSWVQFNSRFYVVALVFLLFDVEMIFIFPWTTVFGQKALLAAAPLWGWLTLAEMFIFVGILIIGLVYVWRKGDLDWIKPSRTIPQVNINIPKSAYERINSEKYVVRQFNLELESKAVSNETPTLSAPKPGFKPTFRKS